jgi:hypothetical protein
MGGLKERVSSSAWSWPLDLGRATVGEQLGAVDIA